MRRGFEGVRNNDLVNRQKCSKQNRYVQNSYYRNRNESDRNYRHGNTNNNQDERVGRENRERERHDDRRFGKQPESHERNERKRIVNNVWIIKSENETIGESEIINDE